MALDRLAPARIVLPDDSLAGQMPPDAAPVKALSRDGQGDRWTAPLPFVPRGLFLGQPPRGLALHVDGQEAAPAHTTALVDQADGIPRWSIGRRSLTIAMPTDRPPERVTLTCQDCAARERRLNRRWSATTDPAAFVRYTATVGLRSREGLLVPAPGEIAFDVDVPTGAVLSFEAMVLPPEWGPATASDGVVFRVVAEASGRAPAELWTAHLGAGESLPVSVAVPHHGPDVRLRLVTDSGASTTADYAFFADPRLTVRRTRPKRVVLAFIDTLRADRTSLHGGPAEATPSLARIGAAGLVFDNAYSVAPWTLPSWRAAITGRRPERWPDGPTLAGRLRERGWATAMFAGNVYLSSNFDGAREWGLHEVALAPPAGTQVDAALGWLEAHRDQDALLVVHLMDPHLPYLEPPSHRDLFAGPAPEGWPESFSRREVLAREPDTAARAWIEGRYLNNVRLADDAIGRLADALAPDDLLVVFSDHGEEFWDEGGFEHGHTLADAVVRVPLVIRHPSAGSGRRHAPASLVDIVPTILGILGMKGDNLDGRDLLATDHEVAPLPLGHALYGYERWGAVAPTVTYRAVAGFEQIAPGPLGDASAAGIEEGRALVERAHQAEVAPALRVAAVSLPEGSQEAVTIRVVYGDPVVAVVPSSPALPTDRIRAAATPTGATIELPQGFQGIHETMLVPPGGRSVESATLWIAIGDEPSRRHGPFEMRDAGDGTPWLRLTPPGAPKLTISPGLAVVPSSKVSPVAPTGDDQREALRQLGYALTAEP